MSGGPGPWARAHLQRASGLGLPAGSAARPRAEPGLPPAPGWGVPLCLRGQLFSGRCQGGPALVSTAASRTVPSTDTEEALPAEGTSREGPLPAGAPATPEPASEPKVSGRQPEGGHGTGLPPSPKRPPSPARVQIRVHVCAERRASSRASSGYLSTAGARRGVTLSCWKQTAEGGALRDRDVFVKRRRSESGL